MGEAGRGYREFVREHVGLVVSAVYLAATGIGMLSSWTFYQQFDINVFHYAQLGDFLLAAVRTPLATLAILLAVPLVWFIIFAGDWVTQRVPWYKRLYGPAAFQRFARSPTAMVLYFIGYAFAFAAVHARWLGDRVRDGGADGSPVSCSRARTMGGTRRARSTPRSWVPRRGSCSSMTRRAAAAQVVPLENLSLPTPRGLSRSER